MGTTHIKQGREQVKILEMNFRKKNVVVSFSKSFPGRFFRNISYHLCKLVWYPEKLSKEKFTNFYFILMDN